MGTIAAITPPLLRTFAHHLPANIKSETDLVKAWEGYKNENFEVLERLVSYYCPVITPTTRATYARLSPHVKGTITMDEFETESIALLPKAIKGLAAHLDFTSPISADEITRRFKGYFSRVCHNLGIDCAEKATHIPLTFYAMGKEKVEAIMTNLESHDAGPDTTLIRQESQQKIEREIRLWLTPGQAQVFLLHFEGNSHQEISESCHIPIGTVKRRLHDARQRLMEHYKLAG